MASSGNTWQKKLMNKQRLHVLKVKGVKARFAVEIDTQVEEAYRDRPLPRAFGRHGRTFGSSRAA